MKNKLLFLVISFMLLSAMPIRLALAGEEYQENVVDKISDWAQTAGKDKAERDRILAANKAERQKKHMEKKAAQMKKQAEKKAENAKKEMKKKMGM